MVFFQNKSIFLFSFLFFLLALKFNNKLLFQTIAVAYGLDNNYFFPTLVSITSILENAHISTFYSFYILVTKEKFSKENKNKFKKLEEKYKKCKINIIEIDENIFKYAKIDRYPTPVYFRLLLAKLVPEFDRIIYLDGDTIVFSDLSEMFNLNMGNNIVLGWIDNSYKLAKEFNITTFKYINSGVLLFNLKKMRKENITEKFLDFIEKNSIKLKQEDQTVINIVLHNRIDLLPPKYGIWTYFNKYALVFHNHYQNNSLAKRCYKDIEVIKAFYNPGIAHYVHSKPWKNKTYYTNKKYRKIWWKYANITGEYENITKYYNIFS